MLKKKKIVVIDQSFKDYTGHHYNYNKYLYDNFNKNFDISFYINKEVDNKIKSTFGKNLFNIFEKTSYSPNYKIILLKKIKNIKVFRYVFFSIVKFDFIFKFISILYKRKFFVTDFFKKLLFLYEKNKNCIFFLHSLSESEFLETLFFLQNNNNNNNNKIYLVYRRDPRFLKDYFLIINKLIDNNFAYLLTDSFKIKNYL